MGQNRKKINGKELVLDISYDIVGIPCELPREKTLFKHIRESKIQSIDEMEIVKIEREEG